jgi:hypothetical protein
MGIMVGWVGEEERWDGKENREVGEGRWNTMHCFLYYNLYRWIFK